MKQSLLIFVILCIISVVNCQTPSSSSSNTVPSASPSSSELVGFLGNSSSTTSTISASTTASAGQNITESPSLSASQSTLIGALTPSSSTTSTASASTTASTGQTITETPSLSASQSTLIGALTPSSSTTSTASASTTASSGQTITETPSLSASQSTLIGALTPSSSTTSTASASTTASSGQTITETPSLSASASSLIGGLTPSSSLSASSTASSGQTITQSSSLSASASAGIINIFSSSPSGTNSASPTPSIGSGSVIVYAVQFAAFDSNLIYDYNDLITYLSRALRVSSITETDPLARKRGLTTTTQVYVSNVTRGSAFESYLVEPSNWVPEFNNISESSVDASQVSVFQDLPTPSTTTTASLFAALFSSTSSASLSASVSPSPAVAYVNIAVSFPDLVTQVINDTDELLDIFSEALNFDISQVSENDPSPGYRRDVPGQTVYVINANPTQADYVNSREWVPRFNQLADLAVEPQSVTIRQLTSTTPSATASIGQTITATPSTTPSFLANSSVSTRPNYAESATCLFEFPYNTTAPYCIDSAQTLYLPWFGPVSSSELPSSDAGSLEVCITVNDPACMSTVPITGRRQQSNDMTSNCSQPFARFWSQWDACQYDFAPYAGNISFDQSNVDNTCAQNTTTTQISYLGNFFGNWSFVQDPCYASSSNQVNRQQRQQVNTPQQRCYCVPYPSGSVFGTGGRFYTELTVYQTADSGVPASIKVTCNPYPCQNATVGAIYPPVEYVKYYSSNDRALILGIVLGFGLPCLIYCIAAIIIAVLILLLLLLLGNGTNAKTFWVPSRDDL